MSQRRLLALVPVAVLTLATAACRDAPVAPGVTGDAGVLWFSHGRDIPRLCRDHYQELYQTDGTGFANVGECVVYAFVLGGTLATRRTATFTSVLLDACNQLSWGVEIDGIIQGPLGAKAFGCATVPGPDTMVTYLSTQAIRVYLRDETCSGWTYFEDGNHALVLSGIAADTIRITDAGGFCESPPGDPRPPAPTGGNLNVIRTIF